MTYVEWRKCFNVCPLSDELFYGIGCLDVLTYLKNGYLLSVVKL